MIPVNEPLFGEREKEYLSECIDKKWISSDGSFVKRFEELVAEFQGARHAIAVSSGTAALEVAMSAIDLRAGDEVIMPTFTIISCAIAVTRLGGIPVLVDCDRGTWNIDVTQIESKVSPKTKAIMVVHIYGHPVNMDPILSVASRYGLLVIEDVAEAQGAEYKNRKCGSMGHLSCFSFYANKIVTTGEGGMVTTNDAQLAERARKARNLWFGNEQRFCHDEIGFNYRMTNLQAAIGVAQMERIAKLIEIKRSNAQLYLSLLSGVEGIQLPREEMWAKNVYWMFGIVLDKSRKLDARQLAHLLKSNGVETRPFFYPLHLQPALKRLGLFSNEKYSVSEDLAHLGLYLPSGLGLTSSQIEVVSNTLINILAS